MKPLCVTIQMKAVEQYFPVVLFAFIGMAHAHEVFALNEILRG